MAEEEKTSLAGMWEQGDVAQLIVFHVGEEAFGIPIEEVREIIQIGQVTPIPDSPDFVKGIINVRGDIIPTIDLGTTFYLPKKEGVLPRHIVITRKEPNIFGLMVDEVSEVLRIPKKEIKPPPKLLTTIHEEYVTGVVTNKDQLIIILDLDAVLSEEEMLRLSAATRRHLQKPPRKPGAKIKKPPAEIPA